MFGRRGTAADSIFYVVLIFLFAVVIIVGYKVSDGINDAIQEQDRIPASGKGYVDSFHNRYANIFDYGFLIIVVFLWIATIVSGMLFETHPALYFVAAFMLFIVLLLAMVFGNVYAELEATESLAAYNVDDEFPIIHFLMQHFAQTMAVFLFTVAAITYARMRYS